MATGVVVIVLVLGLTSEGHVIDAATQRFMLYYAGVFALIGLTTSVAVGLVATDRIFMKPGHRVMAQSVHRAVSFGTLAFLIIHITTEILAQRSHIIDGFIPFLSPYRTFYIGLGTIAADLIVLLVITSIIRKRFTGHGKAWRWRAIHYGSYVAFVFGVLHGLLGGRSGKPYVDWSYGFAIALTALAVTIRFLATSLRPKESLSTSPTVSPAGTGSSPLRAATLTMAQAQLGGTVQMLPIGVGAGAGAGMTAMQLPSGSSYTGYGDGGFTPLGAPPYGNEPYAEPYGETYPYRAVASLPAPPQETRQPLYEPGYVGPPRYEGAPRNPTGPMPRADAGPNPGRHSIPNSGPIPRLGSGPMPTMPTGPTRSTGPTGPTASSGTGPRPAQRFDTGPSPIPRGGTGPMTRPATGPMPTALPSGPPPRAGTGPVPALGPGTMSRNPTGPMPRAATGPMPSLSPGGRIPPDPLRLSPGGLPPEIPRTATGPIPRADASPPPRGGSGPMPQAPSGRAPRHGQAPAPSGRRRRPPADEPRDRDRTQRGGGAWR
ncbi:MAG TPA: hypothetical protein VF070_22385 [Streptosporangiaceae bacterium]